MDDYSEAALRWVDYGDCWPDGWYQRAECSAWHQLDRDYEMESQYDEWD